MPNRLIILLGLISLLTLNSFSKKPDYPRAEIKVSYNYHTKFLRGSDGIVEKDVPFILLFNKNQSKFYCPSTEYRDSLLSTPSGRAKEKAMFDAAAAAYINSRDRSVMDGVVYHSRLYVTKDFADCASTTYDDAGMGDLGYYIEPFSEIDWQIEGDSTKMILDYECILATSDYHGRKWTVWFAPEIPVRDGPWKFCGLAGLIMEATEASGQHGFVVTGIEASNSPIYPVFNKEYEKMNRLDMLRAERKSRNHGNSMIKAEIGLDLGPDAQPQVEYDFLETDYH